MSRDYDKARRWSGIARRLLTAALIATCGACASAGGAYAVPDYLEGRNYAYAVYDGKDSLVHSPLEHLRREMLERVTPISDVYVLVHGWNYTVEESLNLYEGYRYALDPLIEQIKKTDRNYEPFFIFVVWSSVSRPVTNAVDSILPWTPPSWFDEATSTIDTVAFHLPSSWGESQDAMRIAIGPSRRAISFDPIDRLQPFDLTESERAAVELRRAALDQKLSPDNASEYRLAIAAGIERAKESPFHGFQAPLSVLLDELIQIRRGPNADGSAPGPRLHVVGHSFGGKLAALATHDAVQRRVARELVEESPTNPQHANEPLVDSLVLLLPAMQVPEMFCEVPLDLTPDAAAALRKRNDGDDRRLLREGADGGRPTIRYERVAERIGTKVLVYSRSDTANGWVFALGDVLLDHDAIASTQNEFAWRITDDLFYGAYDKVFLGRDRGVNLAQWLCLPLAPVYGAVQIGGRAVYAVGRTVTSDLSAVVDGVVNTVGEIDYDLTERSDGRTWAVTRDVLNLPLSPFLVQRSTGNQGFSFVRPSINMLDPSSTSWLDAEASAFLDGKENRGPDDFIAASESLGAPFPRPKHPDGWITYNGREVYDGWIASSSVAGPVLNVVLPPGAHSDIHSSEKPGGFGGDHEPTKRERTWFFVYNVTRHGLPRPADAHASAK